MKLALCITIIFDSLGWIIGILPPLRYLYIHRSFPEVWGMKLLYGGPFGNLGVDAAILTGLMFIIVSAFKLLAAYWIWQSRMDGAVLELILLGLSSIFWYGFALPFGPPVGLIQIILMAFLWNSLQ